MDNEIRAKILSLNPKLNTQGLIQFIDESGIDIRSVALTSGIGVSVPDVIYIDLARYDRCYNAVHDFMFYFIILHEICHYKRISKQRVKFSFLDSIKKYKKFIKVIIKEEIICDRYAAFLYYKFNRELFPKSFTQKLHLKTHKKFYEVNMLPFWKYMRINKLKYVDFFNSLVVEKKDE